jgi:hypothetical protein
MNRETISSHVHPSPAISNLPAFPPQICHRNVCRLPLPDAPNQMTPLASFSGKLKSRYRTRSAAAISNAAAARSVLMFAVP